MPPKLVVLTGGPGAGKTAVLEVVRRNCDNRVTVLPEAAGIIFGGGFPRRSQLPARRAAQRAIFHVQRQLEQLALEEAAAPIILCDRGTIDGSAYWPGDTEEFWKDIGTSREAELARYSTVIHLDTPPEHQGYNLDNPVRIESADEAAALGRKIAAAWNGHPERHFIRSSDNFVTKLETALAIIHALIPQAGALRAT
jgi:predicted ATPase